MSRIAQSSITPDMIELLNEMIIVAVTRALSNLQNGVNDNVIDPVALATMQDNIAAQSLNIAILNETQSKLKQLAYEDIATISNGGTGADLTPINTHLSSIDKTINDLSVNKAENTAVDTLSKSVSSNTAEIAKKANQSDLASLQAVVSSNTEAIGTKASQSDLNTLSTNTTNSLANKVNTSDVIGISKGGTGSTTSAAARTALSVYSKSETDAKIPSLPISLANGGVGDIDISILPAKAGDFWYKTGFYYDFLYPISNGSVSALAPALNNLYCVPYRILENTTIKNLLINVTSAVANATATLAIFSYNTDGSMSQLATTGVLDCSTTGIKQATINLSVTKGQVVYLAFVYNGASPTVTTLDGNANMKCVAGTTSVTVGSSNMFMKNQTSSMPTTFNLADATPQKGQLPRIMFTV